MRVITGLARGRKLKTLDGLDVRPTTDMVKEAIFSIIQFEIASAKFLDLFAGSGQMGIEALSRGADLAVFCDSNKNAVQVIKDNLQTTGLQQKARVVMMEYLTFLSGTKDVFDIVFLDPPYNKEIIPKVLENLGDKLSENGIVICEHEKGEPMPQQVGDLKQFKTYKYGKIQVTTYKKAEEF